MLKYNPTSRNSAGVKETVTQFKYIYIICKECSY